MTTYGRDGWWPTDALLAGRAALVAGGGRGIGEATSRVLAAAGAAVAVLDLEPNRAESVAASIRADGGTAVPLAADLRLEDDCERAVDAAASELGDIDVLVNVAGGAQYGEWQHVESWSTEAWDAVFHINLRYVFWLCRSVIPRMRAAGGGSIVSVTSISGLYGAPYHCAYGAAKAGLAQLTKTLAVEYGNCGIRVNAVSPGTIVTPSLLEAGRMTAEEQAVVSRNLPSQRAGTPADVARAVLYLASPMSDQITGQMVVLDGGTAARFPVALAGTAPWESARFA